MAEHIKGDDRDREPGPSESAVAELRQLINGYQISMALHVAAELHVADHMTADPCACDEIAAAVGAQPAPLYRLMRALAALGVFREHEGRKFSLAPMGACLRSDAERQLGPFAVFVGQEYQQRAWGRLLHSIRTGTSAFVAAHGMNSWDYRASHPEQNSIYNAAMTGNSRRANGAIARAYDFGAHTLIADIGGGQGSLLAEILIAHPQASGVLFDQPHVVSITDPRLADAGVRHRCRIEAGDMFASVPGGCDAYVMKYVLHDWKDADAVRILQTCRRDMPSAAKLLVIERFIGPPNQDPVGKFADLSILVGPGGQERTRDELETVLRRGGFRAVEFIATGTPLFLTVAEQG